MVDWRMTALDMGPPTGVARRADLTDITGIQRGMGRASDMCGRETDMGAGHNHRGMPSEATGTHR